MKKIMEFPTARIDVVEDSENRQLSLQRGDGIPMHLYRVKVMTTTTPPHVVLVLASNRITAEWQATCELDKELFIASAKRVKMRIQGWSKRDF